MRQTTKKPLFLPSVSSPLPSVHLTSIDLVHQGKLGEREHFIHRLRRFHEVMPQQVPSLRRYPQQNTVTTERAIERKAWDSRGQETKGTNGIHRIYRTSQPTDLSFVKLLRDADFGAAS